MPNLSPLLFDRALNFLYNRTTKIHHKYVVSNIKDNSARLVIESLVHDGLIKVDSTDYYTITQFGRSVVDGGGYRNFSDFKAYDEPQVIPYDTMRDISQFVKANERKAGDPILLSDTNPKKSRARKILDFFAHPDTKTVLQTMVWMITIFGAVLAVVKWVIPWVKSF
ncbi:hypothetical protein [Pedobacter sp. N23S346]|uniref:hypothetical protein n=1 Tax=Pedobacter sp. N23S346 TaxID=3402750 RepID=UPI003AC930C2